MICNVLCRYINPYPYIKFFIAQWSDFQTLPVEHAAVPCQAWNCLTLWDLGRWRSHCWELCLFLDTRGPWWRMFWCWFRGHINGAYITAADHQNRNEMCRYLHIRPSTHVHVGLVLAFKRDAESTLASNLDLVLRPTPRLTRIACCMSSLSCNETYIPIRVVTRTQPCFIPFSRPKRIVVIPSTWTCLVVHCRQLGWYLDRLDDIQFEDCLFSQNHLSDPQRKHGSA